MSSCILHILIDDVFHKECSARLAFGSCDAYHMKLLPYVVVKYPCDLRHGGAYIAYDDMRHIACIARIIRRFRYVCHSAREHRVLKVFRREMRSLAYKQRILPYILGVERNIFYLLQHLCLIGAALFNKPAALQMPVIASQFISF